MSKRTQPLIFLQYLILGVLAFFFVIRKNFSADDFQVIYRVVNEKIFVLEGFFRPLSDITLYFNYLIGGYEPLVYYSFNLLIHITCSWLVCRFCSKVMGFDILYAWIAGLLFLFYPFHNEAIVWAVGRGVSMATVFALAALVVAFSSLSINWKYLLVCIFYFVGLTAYETIFPLPFMLLLLLWRKGISKKQLYTWLLLMLLTLVLHFVIRKSLSGSILGGYADGVFSLSAVKYGEHLFKILGRLFLPPMQNSTLLTLLFAAVGVGFLVLVVLHRRRKLHQSFPLWIVFCLLAASLLVPIVFPVSTRTSETDRLLYFPSVFVCILLVKLVVDLIGEPTRRYAIIFSIIAYFGIFLWLNHSNWVRASSITNTVLAVVKEATVKGRQVYIVNLPDEYKGAFIFRLGFREALLINKIDTSKVNVVNILYRDRQYQSKPVIEPDELGDAVSIFPGVAVYPRLREIEYEGQRIVLPANAEIWYWNNREFLKLDLP